MIAHVEVLDLFSAAAGGWSLGMHRGGYRTIAACEVVPWRRAIYAENNPNVRLYDDVRTLTARRLLDDLGRLPSIVVGSPPCQDISSANTKGRGVEGERSGLYFEAIRIIGEVRPRWAALENSANLRTRGADAVLAALEELGYTCWPFVVRAGDIGANHERPRCWLLACDVEQVANSDQKRRPTDGQTRRPGELGEAEGSAIDGAFRSRNADAARQRPQGQPGRDVQGQGEESQRADIPAGRQMGLCPPDRGNADRSGPDWSLAHLADHLRLDDWLSARLAGTRVAVGDGKGQSAASLVVEAFGDAVIPQIPEAIGRAIERVEAALRMTFAPTLRNPGEVA